MKKNCICCGSSNIFVVGKIPSAIVFAGRILDTPLDGGSLIRCRNCNVSFRYPHLDKESLDELYRRGKSDNWQTNNSERTDWKIAGNWITKYVTNGSNVLDVGCFDGGFLKSLDQSYSIYGIEIHEKASNTAKQNGIEIIGKDFAELKDLDAVFDVITSFDVLEHVENPGNFMGHATRLIKEGGYIIVSTGNTDVPTWRALGPRYWYCTIGEHISFINPSWCGWACETFGLEIVKVQKFSHVSSTLKQQIDELIKNLMYLIAPKGFSVLRSMGLGGEEYRNHQEMLLHPPTWQSADDHFICIFKKS